MKRFAIIAVALAAAVPLTRLTARFAVDSILSNAVERREEELGNAITWIESDFADIQTDLLNRATAVAHDQDARFLTEIEFSGREPAEDVEAAISRFQNRHRAIGPVSVELYGVNRTLRAWTGASILPRPDFDSVKADMVARVRKDPFRRALVLWMPLGEHGLVRVAQALQTTSVESSYLEYKDVSESWREETGLRLDVSFDSSSDPPDESTSAQVQLLNTASEVLGTVTIFSSNIADLVRLTQRRYADVEAFWWVLLLAWCAGGLWVMTDRVLTEKNSSSAGVLGVISSRVALLIGFRYGLLFFDVPGRWFNDGPWEAAFDPIYLASEVSWGIARSVGDLAVTGLFLFIGSVAFFDAVSRYHPRDESRSIAGIVAAVVSAIWLISVLVVGHAELTRQSMLDATLDFFAWTGLSPQPLVLVVFCALLLSTIATLVVGIGILVGLARWAQLDKPQVDRSTLLASVSGALFAAAIIIAVVFVTFGLDQLVPWWSLILHMAAMLWPVHRYLTQRPPLVRTLRLRSIMITALTAAVLLYPLLYAGMDEQRRLRVLDVADEFVARGDTEALSDVRAVLEQIRDAPEMRNILLGGAARSPENSELAQIAYRYPIVDLVPAIRHAKVAFYNADGQLVGAYEQDRQNAFAPSFDIPDSLADRPDPDTIEILSILNPRSRETSGYVGTVPVHAGADDDPSWIIVSLERRSVESPLGSLFGYADWRRSLALAEFQHGRRVRSEGDNFERYILPPEIEDEIQVTPEIWQDEEVYGRAYVTYYRLVEAGLGDPTGSGSVVAVRARAIIPYDHLYYLLRIAIAGFWIGFPAFLFGLVLRWHMGLIPARRSQYGDRVLDAFLIVGTLSVAGMGLVGQQVITRENDGAIGSRLERRLNRVEDALIRAAGPDEPLYEVQRRIPIDSLADQLSLDLTVYNGPWLAETSARLSDAGPLMGYRLPAQAYDELFIQRFRQSFVESSNQYGEVHTIGYKALTDADGWPQSVVAVLTFPEQARIREERARTTAYFFGTLLLLLLVIMATATTLARALTGSLRRLRDGMQSVAAGGIQRPIPVESRDEVGQLVEAFNLMQGQLSESRRKLAQQERDLAWSEMARQVAHEIKNPLTPMKLSIQHLQRAYQELDATDSASKGRFGATFDKITRTVSEQIDTLVDIANAFSTFARLPRRHPETINPNETIREAVDLTATELESGIGFQETADPVFVNVDRDELRRVMINLLKNAVQSVGPKGTVGVATRITAGIGDSPIAPVILCEVTDNGPGIEADVQARIFQPNFSTKTSGMGLGLAIAKKSIEGMGGEIGFRTSLGRGSTFWIKLPLVDA